MSRLTSGFRILVPRPYRHFIFFFGFPKYLKLREMLISLLLGLVQEQWPCPFLSQMEAPGDKMKRKIWLFDRDWVMQRLWCVLHCNASSFQVLFSREQGTECPHQSDTDGLSWWTSSTFSPSSSVALSCVERGMKRQSQLQTQLSPINASKWLVIIIPFFLFQIQSRECLNNSSD